MRRQSAIEGRCERRARLRTACVVECEAALESLREIELALVASCPDRLDFWRRSACHGEGDRSRTTRFFNQDSGQRMMIFAEQGYLGESVILELTR